MEENDGGKKMAGKGCCSPTPADASVANDGHEVAPLLNLSAGSIAANRIALSESQRRSDVTRTEGRFSCVRHGGKPAI